MSKQSQTLCIQAWNQLRHQTSWWNVPNMPTSVPTGTTTTTPANTGPRMPMATPWHWLLPLWWIWMSQTTTPRWPLLEESLHLNAMPPRPSQTWRKSLQHMVSQRYSVLTMTPSLPMHSSLSLQQTGSLTITPVHLGILQTMVKLKQPWRLSKDCSPVPSAQVKTHT